MQLRATYQNIDAASARLHDRGQLTYLTLRRVDIIVSTYLGRLQGRCAQSNVVSHTWA
jgi:hypothetical protein